MNINPFNSFDAPRLLGVVSSKSSRKIGSWNYGRMKEKQRLKRRARNKVARKSRRYNQMMASGKHCKFYKKG